MPNSASTHGKAFYTPQGLPGEHGPMHRIEFIDSHTGGEPTRVVLSGFPDLGDGPLAARLQRMRAQHDAWRQAIACEPRGSDTMVGALLLEPTAPTACAGVI